MHPNKKIVTSKNSPWLLCPSKSFPGKFYYFNGSTGETAWSLNDADNTNLKKPTIVTDKTHAYPEPAGPPADDSNNTSSSSRYSRNDRNTKEFPNTVRNNGFGNILNLKRTFNTRPNVSAETNFSHQSYFNRMNADHTLYNNGRNNVPSPMFGQAVFPKYVCNETAVPKVIWTLTPMLIPEQPTSKKMLDQITQYEPQEYTGIPLTNTFRNFNKYPRFNTFPKEVPTFEQMLARRFRSTKSLVPKPKTKEEGCQTIPKARLRSLSECNTKTVLKSSQSLDDLTVSDVKSSPDADAGGSSNLKTLEDNDLRFVLVAKRRQSMNLDDSSKFEEHTKPKAPLEDLNIKKRVTFALEAQESSAEDVQSNGALSPDSLEIEPEASSNMSEAGNIWFLAADTGVLLAEFECIEQFVLSDKNCRLLVPFVVKLNIEALSKGDGIRRQSTVAARHILRKMATSNTHFVVQQEPETLSACEDDAILKCCWQLAQENQVVLITDDPKLLNKAKIINIECSTLVNFKHSIDEAEKQDPFQMKKVQKPENLFQQTIEELRSFGFAQRDPVHKLFDQRNCANKIEFGNNENDKLINLTNTNKALGNACRDVDEIDDVISRLEITRQMNKKNQNNKNIFSTDDDGIINQKLNQTKLNKDISISGITKLNIEFDLDDELKRFDVKSDGMDVRIKSKRDEWFCRLTQIMEGALMEFLLKEKFKFKKITPPWSLCECIQLMGEKMKNQHKIKNIVERFNTHLISCSKNGILNQNMKSIDVIKLVGLSMILIQNLKETVDFVEFDDADDRLSELIKNIEDPRTDVEFNLDCVITPVLRRSDESEARTPMSYSNKQAEVLEYLKKHFTAMQDYELENDPKIVRTVGKDLGTLKISNNKYITVDNVIEKVEPKVIRNVEIIDVYEEKFKKIEELDYEGTVATFSSENDLHPDGEAVPGGTMEIIDLSECSVLEESFSSGFYNECVLACPLMKAFLTEMRRTFMQIYTFIDESIRDYHDRELYEDKRADVNIKTNMALKYVMEIVDRLQSIVERESGSGPALKELLVQAGDYEEDDETMAKYKDVVTRYLEQAQILEEALQALIMLTRDNSDSVSLKD